MTREQLVHQLHHGTEDEAIEACELLGAMGDPKALGGLLHGLKSPSADVRGAACEALGLLGDARAVSPLVSMLRDDDEDVRAEAFSALFNIGQSRASTLKVEAFVGEDLANPTAALTQVVWAADLEALQMLHDGLEDEDPEVRIGSAYTLGRMGDISAFDTIAKLLSSDPDADVRAAAAFALGDLRAPKGLDALVQAWPHNQRPEDDEVAILIIRAINELEDPRGQSALVQGLSHRDPRTKQLACMGLGSQRATEAIPYLLHVLNDAHEGVQRCAAEALGRIGHDSVIQPLIDGCGGRGAGVRQTIGRALKRLNVNFVIHALGETLSRPETSVRQGAAYLMGQVGDGGNIRRAIKDPAWEVRKAAALGMGTIGDVTLRADLELALGDEAWQVRVAAAEGLKRLGDAAAIPALRKRLGDDHPVVQNAVTIALKGLES
ncbi:MAG: HEAT repeat domain-containing protein [Bradymonadia bacterium]